MCLMLRTKLYSCVGLWGQMDHTHDLPPLQKQQQKPFESILKGKLCAKINLIFCLNFILKIATTVALEV